MAEDLKRYFEVLRIKTMSLSRQLAGAPKQALTAIFLRLSELSWKSSNVYQYQN